jgi:hypothetical protein
MTVKVCRSPGLNDLARLTAHAEPKGGSIGGALRIDADLVAGDLTLNM